MISQHHGLLRQAMGWCVLALALSSSSVFAKSLDRAKALSTSYPDIGSERPDWVTPVTPFSTVDSKHGEISSGIRYRLVDHQINAQSSLAESYFYAMEMDLVSARGVATESTLRFQFNNDYQQIAVHQVMVKRGDQVINKLPTATHQVLNVEPELDSLMVLGQSELMLTLKDIRVGDTLYYAYSSHGTNPVYQGLGEHYLQTSYGVSIDKVNIRVLVDKDERLSIRRRNVDDLPNFTKHDNYAEYHYQTSSAAAILPEPDAPSWFNTTSAIVFSDLRNWSDVVSWAKPMYDGAVDDTARVRSIANDIMKKYDSNRHRIGAALHYAQENVRYWGIETGINSHMPRNANLVTEQGFGDCKDKTVLLISLLRAMDIKASPALVHTDEITRDKDLPSRIHAFNHVITHLRVDGQDHWLDPTNTGQIGALGELYEPDYGKALILDDGQTGLTDMSNEFSGSNVRIAKVIKAGAELDTTATLKVMSYQTGLSAEYARRRFEDESNATIARNARNYYRDYFDELTIAAPVEFKAYSKNRNLITEQYDLGTLWHSDYDDEAPYRYFVADEIRRWLEQPDNVEYRIAPFDIHHPVDITEAVSLHLDSVPKDDYYEDEYDTPWFRLTAYYDQTRETGILNATWRFVTKTSTVSAEDAADYDAAINNAYEWLNFYSTSNGFYNYDEEEAESDEMTLDDSLLTADEHLECESDASDMVLVEHVD